MIELATIDNIAPYDSPGFQVKWQSHMALHKCADTAAVDTWVYKVMKAKMGPSKDESDSESSDASGSGGSGGNASDEEVKADPKKLAKSEDKNKPKGKKAAKAKAKSASTSDAKKKSSKTKGATETGSTKEKKRKDSKSGLKDSKKGTSEEPYVPQFQEHYNGVKLAERQKHFESLATPELVKLVSGGLEQEYRAQRDQILAEWAEQRKNKLVELHELEKVELSKRQQREVDDIAKRVKELSEQPI